MTILLYLLSLLLVQQPGEFGTISGRISGSGAPAEGIRVAATPVEGDVAVARASTTLASIAQTDSQGRYRLEKVPPGRYLIMAGLASPSYYPGVTAPGQGRIVTVAAGQALTDLDFAIVASTNVIAAVGGGSAGPPITGRLRIDDGSPLPEWRSELIPTVEMRGSSGLVLYTRRAHILAGAQFFPSPSAVITISRLPLGYYLKSMTFGTVDLTKGPLNLPPNSPGGQFEIVLTRTPPAGSPPRRKVSGRILDLDFPLSADFELALKDLSIPGTGPDKTVAFVKAGRRDGVFEIENVPAGRYTLEEPYFRSSNVVSLTFEVAANDVTNLDLRRRKLETPVVPPAPSSIKGLVEVKDGTIPEFEIGFTPTRTGAATHPVAVSSGEFSVPLPAGEYRVSIAGLPMGYAVTSVTAGPLDLSEPFMVTEGGIADRFTSKPVSGVGITVKLKFQ